MLTFKKTTRPSPKTTQRLTYKARNNYNLVVYLQKTLGNRVVNKFIQKKLKIGKPNDRYEQEADRIAEKIMTMPASNCTTCDEKERLQPKLADEISPLIQRKEYGEEEEEEEETLQDKRTGQSETKVTSEIENHIFCTKGMGNSLPNSTRAFFEPRFGYDFRQVRIHHDAESARLARQLNAEAFTYGRDIYFGAGKYSPDTTKGKKLLAHELAHVVQQGEEVLKRIQMKKTLKVGVYETKDQSKDIDDAVKEPIAIEANSIKEAADKLDKKKTSENASIEILSFYGHGAPGYQSVGAGKGYDSAKEISVESLNTYTNDYKKMFGTLLNGAKVFLRGCNVGAGKKGLTLLKKVQSFVKTNNNLNILASAWTGKAYHKKFLWIDWWKQTGEMVTGSDRLPKVSWEEHKKLKKKK